MLAHVVLHILLSVAFANRKLIRVIVMGRHGNRCANPQVEMLCPTFDQLVKPLFDVPFRALSRVGIAENWELGSYLRERYKQEEQIIPKGPYQEGSHMLFYSERYPRNVVATQALMQGMYPPGSGMAGLGPLRLNLIPIETSSAHLDQLMNNPRDGPCRPTYKQDLNNWADRHQPKIFAENRKLLEEVAKACGSSMILNPHPIRNGVIKNLPWAAKAISDAFNFAANEGLDTTMGGRLDPTVLADFSQLAKEMVNGSRFGEDRQLTYWVGDWAATLLHLTRQDVRAENAKSLALYMGHRELIYATAHILGIPIDLPNSPPDALPPGCALIIEVYDDGQNDPGGRFLNFTWWVPSSPPGSEKRHAIQTDSLLSLYRIGHTHPAAPRGCPQDESCSLSHIHHLFSIWYAVTGTWQSVCHIGIDFPYTLGRLAALGGAPPSALDAYGLPVLSGDNEQATTSGWLRFGRLLVFVFFCVLPVKGCFSLLSGSPIMGRCKNLWLARDGYESLY
eukprot:gb/GEZN01004987.1/.p1 GENE.gb/GEZN01004987.1/~~gb/GEZN01004987.1/.p1  ORF type:complete len:507 (+),score=19.20 gb/GEZN01004987.1/:121-1641(+)